MFECRSNKYEQAVGNQPQTDPCNVLLSIATVQVPPTTTIQTTIQTTTTTTAMYPQLIKSEKEERMNNNE